MNDLPIKVLLVEDNPGDRVLIEQMLNETEETASAFELACVTRLADGLEHLTQQDVDLVLLDLSLPDAHGLDTFVKLHAQAPQIPIIVLSGLADEDLAVEAVREGAQDYLVKGQVNRHLLTRAMRYAIERNRSEEALAWEAGVNATIADLSRALLSLASIDELSTLMLDEAQRLTGSEFGFVGYVDPQTGHLISMTMTHGIWDECAMVEQPVVFEEFSGLWGWVLEKRQPLLTNDIPSDPRSSGVPEGHVPIEQFVAAPALIGGTLVGQIALANPGRAYAERDLQLVQRLASLYALAIQRKRAEDALRRYADEQAALYAVASSGATHLDPEALLSSVFDVILSVLDADAGWVILKDPASEGVCHLVTQHAVPRSYLLDRISARGHICPACSAVIGDGASEEPMIVSDCDLLHGEELADLDLQDMACIPLIGGEKKLGMLCLAWCRAKQSTEGLHTLFSTIGHQVGLALYNAQLYQAARQVDRLRVINELDRALAATLHPELVAEVTLTHIARALDLTRGALLLLSSDGRAPVERAFTIQKGWVDIPLSLEDAESVQALVSSLAAEEQGISFSREQLTEVLPEGAEALRFSAAEGWAFPILNDQRLQAILLLEGREGPFSLTDEDQALIQAAVGRASQAIENAHLYYAARSRANELATLNEIGLALTGTLDSFTVVHDALAQVQRLFHAQSVALLRLDAVTDEFYFVQAMTEGRRLKIEERLEADQGVVGWTVKHRQPVLLHDAEQETKFSLVAPAYLAVEARAVMSVPLLTPDEVIGVLLVISREPGVYSAEELRTLQALSSTLAVALENASLYEDLKALLREREQAQARLIHTEKMAALGRLVASIAHEINNPLQAVQGCLTLADEELDGDMSEAGVRRYLDIAGTEIDRISAIVRRMRDFYRPAREGMREIDLNGVLNSVLELTNKQLQHADVSVEREFAPDLPSPKANPDHLRQVFLNLVLNAIDAMPAGGALQVRTAVEHAVLNDERGEQPVVRADFSDTGVGMTPDMMAHVFEPFFTTKEHGTGLGLSISYGIVKSHRGDITVSSQLDGGTTFTVLLPVD